MFSPLKYISARIGGKSEAGQSLVIERCRIHHSLMPNRSELKVKIEHVNND